MEAHTIPVMHFTTSIFGTATSEHESPVFGISSLKYDIHEKHVGPKKQKTEVEKEETLLVNL